MRGLFESPSPYTIKKLCSMVETETVLHDGNGDPKWAEQVVRGLFKKLKKPKILDEFERIISSRGDVDNCVVIPVTLDGNAMRRGQPHVLYCRMWRFPWIKSPTELKSIARCDYPYHKRLDQVCINPFHYEAVKPQAPHVPPVVVPRSHNFELPEDITATLREEIARLSSGTAPNESFNGDEMREFLSINSSPNDSTEDVQQLYAQPQTQQMIEAASPSTSYATSTSFYPPAQPNSTSHHGPGQRFARQNSSTTALSPQSYLSEDMDTDAENDLSLPNTPTSAELINYKDPEGPWMSLVYYELDLRVGDSYNVTQPHLLVDGFTAPSNEHRLCLGYRNSCNRSDAIKDARKRIGRGVRFYYIGGEVYCECLSDYPIFVQSPNCNQRHGWHPSTVCKVPPHCNLKIFNNAEFAELLTASVSRGYGAIYALTRMCTFRISFVKGWGADYKRQAVTHTPCWIEGHLHGPLQWVDRVLQSMGVPPQLCSSFT